MAPPSGKVETPAVSFRPWGISQSVLLLGMGTLLAESANCLPPSCQITGPCVASDYTFFPHAFSVLALYPS